MNDWIVRSARSKTMIFAVVLAVTGAVQASSDFLKTLLTPDVFGFVMMGLGIAVAVLRVVTTQPLEDK